MGRWSKEKIKENALELVVALNEHFEELPTQELKTIRANRIAILKNCQHKN